MWVFFSSVVFANPLPNPEFCTEEEGVFLLLENSAQTQIRFQSMEHGCLYILPDITFQEIGNDKIADPRVHFFQKKNLQNSAQILIGFSQDWICYEPVLQDESLVLRIGESDWKWSDEQIRARKRDVIKDGEDEEKEKPSKKKNQRDPSKYLVAIDAGHGGWDAGAVSKTGLREADVVLHLSTVLASALEKKGFEVLLIRETDVFVPLKERALIANQADADIFLSIHANAAPTAELYGVETFSMDTATNDGARKVAKRENALVKMDKKSLDNLKGSLVLQGAMKLSKMLAKLVQKNVMHQLQLRYGELHTRDLGAKTALFYVLVYTKMPSILFEASFLSNPEDERKLRTPHFHMVLVEGMVRAVEEYFILQE